MLPLILSLVRMLLESGRVSDDLPEPIVRRLAEFPHADTAEKLTNWLTTTIDEAIPVIHGRHHSYHLLVHQARQQIRQNYPEGLSLKTLASAFNVSPAYLGLLFKEETGRYFHDDLTQTRLQESQVLLIDTDLKIGEIAKRVGIPNQSYFNRIFKNEYGVSPLEYRRQSQPHGCSRSVPRRSSPEW
jgi:two-component system response regulator YesN